MGQPNAIVIALPTGSASRIKTSIARPEPLLAPINKGQQVGVLKVSLGEQTALEIPLHALEAVQQAADYLKKLE